MKKKLLITFGTRAFAQRIAKMLTEKFDIIFASHEEIPSLLLNTGNYLRIPAGLLPTYAHELLKVSLDKQIDYILPLGVHEIGSLASASVLFEEYGIQVLCPAAALMEDMVLIEEPMREIPLVLVDRGVDMLTQAPTAEASYSGLLMVADEGAAYALAVVAANN